MSKSKMTMCYPYGVGVSCICDARGRIYKCFPNPLGDVGGGGGPGDELDLDGEVRESKRGMINVSSEGFFVPCS